MRRCILCLLLSYLSFNVFAWKWQDLWATPDQQGARYFKKQAYTKAEKTFEQKDWQATAAYRAKNFEKASLIFEQLHNAEGYYNQGNAKAQLGKYKEALEAYEKSLKMRPNDKDTLHNKKIIESLLKKQEQSNANTSKNDAEHTENSNEDTSQQKDSTQQSNNKQEQESDASPKTDAQNAGDEPQAPANKLEEAQKDKPSPTEQTPNQEETEKEKPLPSVTNPSHAEDYQTTEQWLNMIPEDPGGLLRQKFLRDHRRRIHGEAP